MLINKGKVIKYQDYKQENKYRIAIPSYKRSDIILKTLGVLRRGGIDADRIDIFVANNEEYNIYKENVPKELYSNLIVGEIGMKNIRNYIQDYYNQNENVVCLDDDIEEIYEKKDDKTLTVVKDLNSLFNYSFALCKEVEAKYWGVYAVKNPFFMDRSIALGLRFLEGSMWGMIVDKDNRRKLVLDEKEDFERSIKGYLLDGNVVRLDFISFKSKEFTEKGGMQYDGKRTEERNIASGMYLIKTYPFLCKKNNARKKRFEVRLVEQRDGYKELANLRLKLYD